jgi:hypothetical protein
MHQREVNGLPNVCSHPSARNLDRVHATRSPPPRRPSQRLLPTTRQSAGGLTLRETPRWKLAISDADLKFPHAAETFSCELGTQITEQDTPALYGLLRRTARDASQSTYAPKNQHRHPRPFNFLLIWTRPGQN